MKAAAHYQSIEFDRIARLFATLNRDRAKPLRVLDFGCGRGKYLSRLSALGCDVTGIDSNPDYVEEARSNGFKAFQADKFWKRSQAHTI